MGEAYNWVVSICLNAEKVTVLCRRESKSNLTKTMPLPSQAYGQQGPSCWDRTKTGFGLGFCVGMASGLIFGGFGAIRYGMRGRELMSNVGKTMVQGGGTFGTFMAIGSAIRCWPKGRRETSFSLTVGASGIFSDFDRFHAFPYKYDCRPRPDVGVNDFFNFMITV